MNSEIGREVLSRVHEFLEQGAYQEALGFLQSRKSDLEPGESLGFEYMICAEQGDLDRATEIVAQADHAGFPLLPSIRTLSWVCDGLVKRGQYCLGLRFCNALVKKDEGGLVVGERIRFMALTRNFLGALELLREVWPQIPPVRQLDFGILEARLLFLLGKEKLALEKFSEYLPHPMSKQPVYDRAARLAIRQRKFNLAHRFINQSKQIFGTKVQHYLLMATIYNHNEDYDRSIAAVDQALNFLDRDNEFHYVYFRQCYELVTNARLSLMQYDLALETLLDYTEVDPKWVRGKILIIECFIALQIWEKADETLRDLLEGHLTAPGVTAIQRRLNRQFSKCSTQDDGMPIIENKPNEKIEAELMAIKVPDEFMPQWTGRELHSSGAMWKGLKGHARSVEALLLRESRTRFVRHKMGMFWLFLAPLAQVSFMVIIFLMVSRQSLYGMSIPLFIITGLVPYQFFASSFNQMTSAVPGNKALFMHPRVQVLDVIVARAGLETLAASVVFAGFLTGLAFLGEELFIEDMIVVLLGFLGLLCCGTGLGLITSGIKIVLPGVATILQYSVRFLFFTSGVFFAPEMFSQQVRDIMLLNPLLHYISMVRSNFTPLLGYDNVDFLYAFVWALGMLTFGLIFERVFRFKLLSA